MSSASCDSGLSNRVNAIYSVCLRQVRCREPNSEQIVGSLQEGGTTKASHRADARGFESKAELVTWRARFGKL